MEAKRIEVGIAALLIPFSDYSQIRSLSFIEERSSEYEMVKRRLDRSESCQMQRVASLLGQALSLPVHPELIAMCSPIRAVRE